MHLIPDLWCNVALGVFLGLCAWNLVVVVIAVIVIGFEQSKN